MAVWWLCQPHAFLQLWPFDIKSMPIIMHGAFCLVNINLQKTWHSETVQARLSNEIKFAFLYFIFCRFGVARTLPSSRGDPEKMTWVFILKTWQSWEQEEESWCLEWVGGKIAENLTRAAKNSRMTSKPNTRARQHVFRYHGLCVMGL